MFLCVLRNARSPKICDIPIVFNALSQRHNLPLYNARCYAKAAPTPAPSGIKPKSVPKPKKAKAKIVQAQPPTSVTPTRRQLTEAAALKKAATGPSKELSLSSRKGISLGSILKASAKPTSRSVPFSPISSPVIAHEPAKTILVLLDGDGYRFHTDLVRKGLQGGFEAGRMLHRQIRKYVKAVLPDQECSIIINICSCFLSR